MEYTSQEELYRVLRPVFNVKKRLISISKFPDITDKDIWKYLSENIWKYDIGLTLSDVINDIINVDIKLVNDYIGGKNEEM